MAVFNGAKFLTESINSILNQSFSDFEFIIIDDGSADDSVNIVRNFGDKRIRFFKNDKNRGLPYSLNQGIKLSRGDYLVRMDQDDVSFPKRIAIQVDYMDVHPDVDICGAAVKTTLNNHKIVSMRPEDSEEIKATLLFNNVLSHSSVIIRKKAIEREKLFYDPAIKNAEDYEFWTRCCWKLKITNLTTPLVFYRRHQSQMVNQPTIRSIIATSRNKMLKRFVSHPIKTELALHSRIANGTTATSWEEIRAVETWLIKISIENNQKQLVKQEAMRLVLEGQWFNVCAKSAKLGVGVIRQYLGSPITSHAFRRWDHVFILLAKICLSLVKL